MKSGGVKKSGSFAGKSNKLVVVLNNAAARIPAQHPPQGIQHKVACF